MSDAQFYRRVAHLHAACIDQGFLTQLGEGFLALMYEAIDESPSGWLITESDHDQVVGFVSGCVAMRPIYARMLRRPLRLLATLAPSLLRASRLKRIVEILRYGRKRPPGTPLPRAELLSIALAPTFRGQGRADALYHRLEERFAAMGVMAFRVTVGESLLGARRFYARMGAVRIGEVQVHSGERSLVYVQRVPEPSVARARPDKGPGEANKGTGVINRGNQRA